MKVTVQLNLRAIESKCSRALEQFAKQYGEQMQSVMRSPLFSENQNEPGDRDVVDTGELARSQRFQMLTPTQGAFTWLGRGIWTHEDTHNVDGTIRPGRPWTRVALRYAERFRKQP